GGRNSRLSCPYWVLYRALRVLNVDHHSWVVELVVVIIVVVVVEEERDVERQLFRHSNRPLNHALEVTEGSGFQNGVARAVDTDGIDGKFSVVIVRLRPVEAHGEDGRAFYFNGLA